jgi:hypothetical protein
VDTGETIRDHFCVPAFPRCGALLRNGQPCGRTAAADSEFCVHHAELLESLDAESLRQGKIPKRRALKDSAFHVIAEPPPVLTSAREPTATATADPATVRPSLAAAAAENVEQLKTSLLEAAGSAVKPVWLTVECSACGERSRIEAPVPDVRARVAAIELLLREGLGRPATVEGVRSPQMPISIAAVREMSWDEMQALFAAIYVDEIAAAQRDGSEAVLHAKVASLSESERRVLRAALDEHAP